MASNVTIAVEGSKILIEIDGAQSFGPSGSGKTEVVGTTHGFTTIECEDRNIMLSVNAVVNIPKHLRVLTPKK